jgi:hypothetical protein
LHLKKLNKSALKNNKSALKNNKSALKNNKSSLKIIKALWKIIKALCRKYTRAWENNTSAWEKYTATWSWHFANYPGWVTHLCTFALWQQLSIVLVNRHFFLNQSQNKNEIRTFDRLISWSALEVRFKEARWLTCAGLQLSCLTS